MASTDPFTARLTALLETPGTWTTVLVDESGNTSDPRGTAATQRTSIADAAARDGAPEADVAAIREALSSGTGLPAPVTRLLLVSGGSVALDEAVPVATGAASTVTGPLPDLPAILALTADDFGFVTVSVSKDGGDVALRRTGGFAPVSTSTERGRTDNLHAVGTGGESDYAYTRRVEQQWKDNAAGVAARVDRVVQDARPRLVVVSGDVQARSLLQDALAERSRELVAVYPKDLRTDGADDSGLEEFIGSEIDRLRAEDSSDALDVLRQRQGEGGAVTAGTGHVVDALREARVQQLLLDPAAQGEATLVALGEQPWIASDRADGAAADVAPDVPAAAALVRAALLTDAEVRLVTSSALDGESVAALLRWADPA